MTKTSLITILLFSITSCLPSGGNKKNMTESKYVHGPRSIINKNTQVYQSGNYVKGFKVGKWAYEIEGKSFTKTWKTHKGKDETSYNVPIDWDISSYGDIQFSAVGPVYYQDSAQVVILRKVIEIDDHAVFLKAYKSKYHDELESKFNILEEDEQCFVNNGQEYPIAKFHLYANSKNYFCLRTLVMRDGNLFDITYYFKSTNWKMHYNIFFDFLNGVKYKANFLTNHENETFDPIGFVYCDTIEY